MKKRFSLLSVVLFVLAVSAFGQRSLEIKDVTEGLKVFSGKDTEAGMDSGQSGKHMTVNIHKKVCYGFHRESANICNTRKAAWKERFCRRFPDLVF